MNKILLTSLLLGCASAGEGTFYNEDLSKKQDLAVRRDLQRPDLKIEDLTELPDLITYDLKTTDLFFPDLTVEDLSLPLDLTIPPELYIPSEIPKNPTFQLLGNYPTGYLPISIVASDFDYDGNIDLAVANNGERTVSVLVGNGNGTFKPQVKYNLRYQPWKIVLLGNDILTANANYNNLTHLGNQNGIFGTINIYPTQRSPFDVTVGDFNNDGLLDIVAVASFDNGIAFHNGLNYSNYRFMPIGIDERAIVSCDWNDDGNLDIALTSGGLDDLIVAFGDGNGSFNNLVKYHAGHGVASALNVDINNDSLEDIATANYNGNSVSIFKNIGNGVFQHDGNYSTDWQTRNVRKGDFNNDGYLDLVTANITGGTASVLINRGNGIFNPAINYIAGNFVDSYDVAVGDFNNDGDDDFAVVNMRYSNVAVFINN